MVRGLFLSIVSIYLILFLCSCATIRVYINPDEPLFFSNDIFNNQGTSGDTVVVVSFNIEKAKKIQQAISELQSFQNKFKIDVLLLQEMDETAVREISGELKMNYVYIPIVFNRLQKKNVGNAILAKGKISDYKKLILPNTKWFNGRRRSVTVGEVQIRNRKILVYSVHTETSSMSRKKRLEQLDSIIENAKTQSAFYNQVIIGGDFNTLHKKDKLEALQKFSGEKFEWASDSSGTTAHALSGLVKPCEDYIFCKGFQRIYSGKIDESESSDHYPVFGVLRIEN